MCDKGHICANDDNNQVYLHKQIKSKLSLRNVCYHSVYNFVSLHLLSNNISIIFFHDTTAPSGPGPPHYQSFVITLGYTTLGRTPLVE